MSEGRDFLIHLYVCLFLHDASNSIRKSTSFGGYGNTKLSINLLFDNLKLANTDKIDKPIFANIRLFGKATMTIDEMKRKILSDRELIAAADALISDQTIIRSHRRIN